MEQQVLQEATSHLWDILLYLVWPAVAGSYLFSWKLYAMIKADLALLRSNELHELGERISGVATEQAVSHARQDASDARLDRLEDK